MPKRLFEDMTDAELDDIQMRTEMNALLMKSEPDHEGIAALFSDIIGELEKEGPRDPSPDLCRHCRQRPFVGAWLAKGSRNPLILCSECANGPCFDQIEEAAD
jgi:hypothetical protein